MKQKVVLPNDFLMVEELEQTGKCLHIGSVSSTTRTDETNKWDELSWSVSNM